MAIEEPKDPQVEENGMQNGHNDKSTKLKKETKPKSSAVPKKRKADKDEKPAKAPRRSARGSEKNPIEPVRAINYLLSPDASNLCRPKDEAAQVAEKGDNYRTYSSHEFSPFEELLCACVLSRPISHALGLRSIRTLLNDPHNYTTPKAIIDAGFDQVRGALDEARTQHRQKTAEQLITLASVVAEKFSEGDKDVSMEKIRQDSNKDIDQVCFAQLLSTIETDPA